VLDDRGYVAVKQGSRTSAGTMYGRVARPAGKPTVQPTYRSTISVYPLGQSERRKNRTKAYRSVPVLHVPGPAPAARVGLMRRGERAPAPGHRTLSGDEAAESPPYCDPRRFIGDARLHEGAVEAGGDKNARFFNMIGAARPVKSWPWSRPNFWRAALHGCGCDIIAHPTMAEGPRGALLLDVPAL